MEGGGGRCWLRTTSVTAIRSLVFFPSFFNTLVYGSYNIVTDQSIKNYNTLMKFPTHTITECAMKCNTEPECHVPSFKKEDERKICFLLEMRDQGNQETKTKNTTTGSSGITIIKKVYIKKMLPSISC